MKVLLRSDFKWHECTFDIQKGQLYCLDTKKFFGDSDAVAIQDDERPKYVKCVNCGQILRKTKKAIEEHCSKKCDEKACLSCPHRRESKYSYSGKSKYTLLPDGNFQKKEEYVVKLTCGNGWCAYDIRSQEARDHCIYRGCTDEKENFVPIPSFFSKYPNAFDELATVDALDEKMWEFSYKNGNRCTFKARKKFGLYANVNERGIITSFYYQFRNITRDFVYSKKYKKIFWMSCGYSESTPYEISANRLEEIKQIIERIYATNE